MKKNKCSYKKCEHYDKIFVQVEGKKYHFICWLKSMDIDLNTITFNTNKNMKL
jgi:hypothetical protein